jgi:hypothetical protein
MSSEFRAPSRLKSRIYSALVEQREGRLLSDIRRPSGRSLSRVKAEGRKLCVFEELVQIAPIGESAKRPNLCRICHARILAETIENAPVYWPGCPYVQFQNR